jgi:serine/threonine-protein kinase
MIGMARNVVPGTTFDRRYRIVRKLATGSIADTYAGERLDDGRRVVLRFVHAALADDPSFAAWFTREIERLRALRGEPIVAIHDAGEATHGTLFVATEHVEPRLAVGSPMAWSRVVAIVARMCQALHVLAADTRRFDANKIYLPDGGAVLDVVGLVPHERLRPVDSECVIRPPAYLDYLSPEHLMGKPIDGRSNVYILGVLAYELATGSKPFPDAKGPAGLITAQIKQHPIAASQRVADLPAAADAVIMRCLAKAREDRFADPLVLRDAFAST